MENAEAAISSQSVGVKSLRTEGIGVGGKQFIWRVNFAGAGSVPHYMPWLFK